MRAAVNNFVAKTQKKAQEFMAKLVKGDSHFLAVAVVMIIVVVLASVFRTQLLAIFNSVFASLNTEVNALF